MARKTIQGITIEIGGNTTKLQNALKGAESKIKDTQNALKDVGKLLKLDPSNVQLLTQKQNLLKESIEATGDKLRTLKDAAAEANDQLARGEISQAQYDALQREIVETENDLKSLTREMKDFGSVGAQQLAAVGEKVKGVGEGMQKAGTAMSKYVTAPIVAAGAASVAAFNEVDDGLDIIVKKTGATGKALDDMEARAMNLATTIPTDFRTAGEAIGEVSTRFDLTGDALEALSAKFIKYADLNDTSVSASIDSVQAAMAAFDVSADKAGNVLDILNRASHETGVDVNRLTDDLTANATALREMGFRINGATGFLARLNKNGLDSSAVLSGMKKALQNATKQGKTMSQALGEMEQSILSAKSETEAMRIASELFGAKSAPAMVKAIREGRISFDEMSNAVRQTANSVDRTFEETLDPMDEFKTTLNELKIIGTDLVRSAAPLIKSVAEALKNAVQGLRAAWESLSPAMQENIIQFAGVAAAVGPVLLVGGKLVSGIGTLMTLGPQIVGIVSTVKGALSGLWALMAANPVGAIIAAVAALGAAFMHFWNTSEAFRDFWKNLWEGLKTTVKNAVDKIREFFSFKWELPKIPLPHFKIEGSFSLAPPSVPRLSIDWYAKAMKDGMILTSPTIFGMSGGKLLGGGEAGPEAVVGLDSLRGMVASAVAGAMPRGNAPRSMTVVLELNKTELARAVYRLNNEEMQRVGVRLSTPN